MKAVACETVILSFMLCIIYLQRYLALDDRIAWAHYELPQSLFEGETIEEWIVLTGKQGDGKEGNLNVILSFTANARRD